MNVEFRFRRAWQNQHYGILLYATHFNSYRQAPRPLDQSFIKLNNNGLEQQTLNLRAY